MLRGPQREQPVYTPDTLDTVVLLADFPQSDSGAPEPAFLRSEHRCLLAFRLQDGMSGGTGVTIVDPSALSGERAALVEFVRPCATLFGPPGDETLRVHPLAARGLKPAGAYEVRHSSWVRALVRMDAVHPRHRPERFQALRHFVITFHDSTFECVAEGLSVTERDGAPGAVLAHALQGAPLGAR
jgi:hypothetical protein